MEEFLYRQFYEVEKKHWWFVARQHIVRDVIDQRLELVRHSKVLDVGCGTGAILESLAGKFDAYGIDNEQLAIEFCKKRGINNLYRGTLETFPSSQDQFDLVTLLDVIEHTDDDLALLCQVHKVLKPGGTVLITVPAFRFLWGKHDDINHHKRRYIKSEIERLLVDGGFSVQMVSYYNTFLFPAALIQRLIQRIFRPSDDKTLSIPSEFANRVMTFIFSSERFFIRRISFPVGLSIIAMGSRPIEPENKRSTS